MDLARRSFTRGLKLLFSVSLAGSFLVAVYLRFYSGLFVVTDLPEWTAYLLYLVLALATWNFIEHRLPLAGTVTDERSIATWLWRLAQVCLLTLAIVSVGVFFWRDYSFSRYTIGIFWLLHFTAAGTLATTGRVWWRRRYGLPRAEVWLAGGEISDHQLEEFGRRAARALDVRRLPSPESLLSDLHRPAAGRQATEVLVALGAKQASFYPAVAARLAATHPGSGVLLAAPPVEPSAIQGYLFLVPTDSRTADTLEYVVSKRVFDFVVAGLGVLALSPLLGLTALLIRARLGRPVLFKQRRVGRGGAEFLLYKFRTLPLAALESSDHQWAVAPPNRLAAFLRAAGFDELPQLFNVLRGEMSLVGPRPERPHFVERFQSELPFYSTRHRLQVGITGWAQVNGWRGNTSIARRVEYDLYYLNHWSLGFDLRILALTAAGLARNLFGFGRAEPKARDARVV